MHNPLVVLAEDNPDDVELTRRAFVRAGFDVDLVVVRDGVEALDVLLGGVGRDGAESASTPAPKPMPALLLLDLKLPRVDGFEVLERLRACPWSRRLPVVVLSSSDDQRDLYRAYELGANGYVRKPVDFHQFTTALGGIAHYWLEINQVPGNE